MEEVEETTIVSVVSVVLHSMPAPLYCDQSFTEPGPQKVSGPLALITGTAGDGFTVMVMVLDVAGLGVAQAKLAENSQVMASPFAKLSVV